jgi:hypothetical protein
MSQDRQAGAAAIVELFLTGIVLLLGRDWKGHRRGAALNPCAIRVARGASLLLWLSTLWNVALMVYRLHNDPSSMGNKDELTATTAGFAALWVTDVMSIRRSVRRRRRIAILLAQFPTFRFGRSSYGSPLPKECSSSELVIRSACWDLINRQKPTVIDATECFPKWKHKQYWRGSTVRAIADCHADDKSRRGIVVLHDPTTQDEAGAELLVPAFTHSADPSNQLIANTIWKSITRSKMWMLAHWDREFGHQCTDELKKVPGVNGIRKGELWETVQAEERAKMNTADGPRRGHSAHMSPAMSEADVKEFDESLWAALTLEVMNHLDCGAKLVLLKSIVTMPESVLDATWSPASEMMRACNNWRTFVVSEKKRRESQSALTLKDYLSGLVRRSNHRSETVATAV